MSVALLFVLLEALVFSLALIDYKKGNVWGTEKIKTVSSVILIVVLSGLSGFRYNVGRDFMMYETLYYGNQSPGINPLEVVWNYLYQLFNYCGFSSVSWFLCTSFVINVFFVLGIKRMSKDFYVSMAFYLCIPQLYLESFNAVRQFVAMAIVFYWSYLFFEKKYIKFLIVLLGASFFHQSALLTIPFFVLSVFNFPNVVLVVIISLCFILRNSLWGIISVVMEKLPIFDRYAHYAHIYVPSESNTGLYSIVLLCTLFFIVFRFRKSEVKDICILKNLSIIGFCVYLLCYTFLVGMRMSFYVLPFFTLLVPYMKEKDDSKLSLMYIGTLFCAFFMFTLKASYDVLYQLRF